MRARPSRLNTESPVSGRARIARRGQCASRRRAQCGAHPFAETPLQFEMEMLGTWSCEHKSNRLVLHNTEIGVRRCRWVESSQAPSSVNISFSTCLHPARAFTQVPSYLPSHQPPAASQSCCLTTVQQAYWLLGSAGAAQPASSGFQGASNWLQLQTSHRHGSFHWIVAYLTHAVLDR